MAALHYYLVMCLGSHDDLSIIRLKLTGASARSWFLKKVLERESIKGNVFRAAFEI